jgi:hypothetical protein
MPTPLGSVPVEERLFKADLELLDRYVGFSSEIVRISLLGLAAVGFYLKEFVAPSKEPTLKPGQMPIEIAWFNLLLGSGALLFAIAVGWGLLHRFYATDGVASHIHALRLAEAGDPKAERRFRMVTRRYRIAGSWLVSGECAAAAATGVLGIAFAVRFGIFTAPKWLIATNAAKAIVAIAIFVAGVRWAQTLWKVTRKDAESQGVVPADTIAPS